MVLRQVKVPYQSNYDFGIGVDVVSSSPMGKVVDGAVSGVERSDGSMTSFAITRIHTTSELEDILGISADASLGCGLFSASARFDYTKRVKVQRDSLFMGVTAKVSLENLSIDNPTLTPEAAKIINLPDLFSSRYGNMFVRGIERGGLFIGLIQINTLSSEESESISAKLQGSFGLFSAEASTNFQEIKKNKDLEISISVYHEGGPVNVFMSQIDDPIQLYNMLKDWLTSFQTNPDQNSVPYYVTLAPITIANGPIPPNSADIQHAQDILTLCARERSRILDDINLMDYISRNTSRYDFVAPTTPETIVKSFTGLQADLDLISATASRAINNVTDAVTPANYAKMTGQEYPHNLPDPMPALKKSVQSSNVDNSTFLKMQLFVVHQ